MKASVFRNFNVVVEDKSLIVISKEIIEGKYKDEIENVQKVFAAEGKEAADELKKKLLGFTPSATFKGGRKKQYLTYYSQCIVLDLDNLTPEQLEAAFKIAASISYTFFCFRSPKGNGLKIFVIVTSALEHHETAYKQVADYYQAQLGITIDRSGKDVTRLCFYSYDPLAYKNINSEKFPVQIEETITMQETIKPPLPASSSLSFGEGWGEVYHNAVQFTENVAAYSEGNRNNFVHRLGCNCNRDGIPQADALQMILLDYNYDEKEVTASVKSAYTNNTNEFAKSANFARSANEAEEHLDEEFNQLLSSTPYIPDEVFTTLPKLLQIGCNAFENKRERDIFLTGALTILSGCMSNVSGTYDNRTVFANLFCFGIAPPASGKGAFISARDLGKAYHKKLLAQSQEEQKQYKIALQQYKMEMRDSKNKSTAEPPEEPRLHLLYIPANSSSAAVIRMLDSAEGKGIICETESDTLSSTFKQDWGGYSEMLRKAFHHEPITYNRKTNNEHVEIETPQLSVGIVGTPLQALSLILSAEDGLFSRFLFYLFRGEMKWRDVSPGNRVNLTTHFNQLSEEVKTMIEYLDASPTTFNLSTEQWKELNSFFSSRLDHAITFVSEDFSGTLMRLGLIAFRIAMVITAIRKFEDGVDDRTIICDDQDFKTTLMLAEVYLKHATLMFKHLPKGKGTMLEPIKQKFFNALPAEFSRQEAVAIGKDLKIAERTVDKYLKQFLGKFLSKPEEYGQYKKL